MPPSKQFSFVFRVEATVFLQRQDAFVAGMIKVLASFLAKQLPSGNLLLEDFRADEDSDGYLRSFEASEGKIRLLFEVASWRRSDELVSPYYEVMANTQLPEEMLLPVWDVLRTGSGLDKYHSFVDPKMPSAAVLAERLARPVIGTQQGERIRLQEASSLTEPTADQEKQDRPYKRRWWQFWRQI
jgi:hypothetical protein